MAIQLIEVVQDLPLVVQELLLLLQLTKKFSLLMVKYLLNMKELTSMALGELLLQLDLVDQEPHKLLEDQEAQQLQLDQLQLDQLDQPQQLQLDQPQQLLVDHRTQQLQVDHRTQQLLKLLLNQVTQHQQLHKLSAVDLL